MDFRNSKLDDFHRLDEFQDDEWRRRWKKNNPNLLINFRNEEDIIEFTDKFVGKENPEPFFPVGKIPSLQLMMRNGLVPSGFLDKKRKKILSRMAYLYLKGYDRDDVEFWYPPEVDYPIDPAKSVVWYYFPLQYVQNKAIRKGDGFLLSLMLPSAVYSSFRPKTDMMLFRTPSSLVKLNEGGWYRIPVTRYAKGMSSGKYRKSRNDCDFCGTFYYYEPESTTMLAYRNAYKSFNKITAFRDLGGRYIDEERILEEWTDKKYPLDLQMTRGQVNKTLGLPVTGDGGQKEYAAQALDLYAAEDGYDQELCELAKKKGYDIIILTHMPGGFQVVTEILDTRDRIESFRSLIFS